MWQAKELSSKYLIMDYIIMIIIYNKEDPVEEENGRKREENIKKIKQKR